VLSVAAAVLLVLGSTGLVVRTVVPHLTLPSGLVRPVACALGLLVVGDLALALGLAGLLRSPVVMLGLVALSVVGLIVGRRALGVGLSRPSVAVVAIGVVMAVLLVVATVPTVFYDGLLYHLGSPSGWLVQGHIDHEPGLFQSGLPVAGEMLFLVGMTMVPGHAAGVVAAQALAVLVAGVLLIAVAGAAAADDRPGAPACAALLLVGSPMFLELAYLPKSDTLAALFALLAAAVAAAGAAPFLTGLLFTAAATAKTTAALVTAAPIAMLFLWRRRSLRAVGLAALGGLVVVTPWLGRELIIAARGGPENGFLNTSDVALASMRLDGSVPADLGAQLRSIGRVPIEIVTGGRGIASRPGLTLVLAIGFGIWAAVRDRTARALLVAGLMIITIRAGFTEMPRYGLAGYGLLAVAGGRGLAAWLRTARPAAAAAAGVVIGLTVIVGIAQGVVVVASLFAPQRVLLGHESRHDYLVARIPSHRAIVWMNENLRTTGGRVLLVGETRRLYLELPHVVADEYHANPLHRWLLAAGDVREVMADLERDDIGFILRNRAEEVRLLAKGASGTPLEVVPRVDRFLRSFGRRLYADDAAEVWAVTKRAGRPTGDGPGQ